MFYPIMGDINQRWFHLLSRDTSTYSSFGFCTDLWNQKKLSELVRWKHQHSCMPLFMTNKLQTKFQSMFLNNSKKTVWSDITSTRCKIWLVAYALRYPYSRNIRLHQKDQRFTSFRLKKFLKIYCQMMGIQTLSCSLG